MGCICISLIIDDFYKSVKWLTKTHKNVYIHRLAIHPNYQGKGLALKLMDFANEIAIKNNCESIRLDTFDGNQETTSFIYYKVIQKLVRYILETKVICLLIVMKKFYNLFII